MRLQYRRPLGTQVLVAAILTAWSTAACAADKAINWESGKVLSQGLGSEAAGAYASPMGRGAIAVPLYRRSNIVTVETADYRYQWAEVGRKLVILPVNGEVRFYRDGKFFIVLDMEKKKHKFAVIGITAR